FGRRRAAHTSGRSERAKAERAKAKRAKAERAKAKRAKAERTTTKRAMLKNYLTVTLRGVRRQAGYAALNVAGLAVGIAACLLIGVYLRDELAYDRFHAKGGRSHRVVAGNSDDAQPTTANGRDPRPP